MTRGGAGHKGRPRVPSEQGKLLPQPLFEGDAPEKFSTDGLYALIAERKAELPAGSYTTYLFEKGREKILKKVGEECTEVIIAAMKDCREETIYEVSDLAYHVLVLLCELGIEPQAIRDELARRHVVTIR